MLHKSLKLGVQKQYIEEILIMAGAIKFATKVISREESQFLVRVKNSIQKQYLKKSNFR